MLSRAACYADQLCLPIREKDARRAADLDLRELRRRTSLIVRRQTCRRTVHRFAAPSYTARTGTERERTPNRAREGASYGIGKSEGWYAGGGRGGVRRRGTWRGVRSRCGPRLRAP